jgi:hypothetical protein
MNNQTTAGRGARGGGRVKTPSRPPRFSKNSATQSQVLLKTKIYKIINILFYRIIQVLHKVVQ